MRVDGDYTTEDEADLAQASIAGDGRAFEELVRRYRRRLVHYCGRITGSFEDGEDAAQEALWRAYRALPTFRGGCSFAVLLMVIGKNVSIDKLRSRAFRHRGIALDPLCDGYRSDAFGPIRWLPDRALTPLEQVLEEERRSLRWAVVRRISPKLQYALQRRFDGASYAAIAAELGVAEGTIKSRLNRAREVARTIYLTRPAPAASAHAA